MLRRFAALLLAPTLLLGLTAGCSSTAMPMDDGAAGAPGRGGTTGGGGATGSGGASGQDAGNPCESLPALYDAAYQRAIACNPALNSPQCDPLASPSLVCQGCQLHVHDTTELDQIRAQYNAAHCPPVPCPAIACINPGTGACVPVDGGATGRCGAGPF